MSRPHESRKRSAVVVAFAALALLTLSGAAPARRGDACTCEDARRVNGWCEACEVGYVGDVPIRSRYLWHVLDAHGHRLNVPNLGCAGCTEAARTDGYCAKSRIGFLDGQAYFSRLTWLLAGAERREAEQPDCPVCRENRSAHGWCVRCEVGRYGRHLLRDRVAFDALVHDMELLALANHAAQRCEHCAAAIVTDTQCPRCRIRFEAGRPVEAESAGAREGARLIEYNQRARD